MTQYSEHREFILECHRLAIQAGEKGNHTFGAVLVYEGQIVARAENTVNTDDDQFQHAEYRLVHQARRELTEEVVRQSTLYTSTEPCFLCAASILMAGIPCVVYSVGYESFGRILPPDRRYIAIEEVAQRLRPETEIIGPVLEEEGMKVYQYWGGEFAPLEELLRRFA